ncbi:MAG: SPOR domain-containing protein [Sphingobacteriia bacterium]|nr:SPOR domain-containing protein [Sphingobacteriia bacterium]
MKKIYKLAFLMMLLSPLFAFTQTGNVKIIADSRLDTLIVRHVSFNKANTQVNGWRVQIFFESGNNSKSACYKSRDRFLELFPLTGSYITFTEPYYKLRVGDFRSRLDAEAFLQEVITTFPNAYIVQDMVNSNLF